MSKHPHIIIISLIFLFLSPSCHKYEQWDNDAKGNFDALWTIIDQHYCFFAQKEIDWVDVGNRYRQRIVPGITQQELFVLCSEMLDELKDGHTNLISGFNVSYYRKWWSDYPQDFDLRVLQQYYLKFDYQTTSGISYKIMSDNIGYIYYPSFSYTVGEGNLDWILSYLSKCNALIIDVRNNGGGELTNIKTFVSRFIHDTTIGGYIRHKTGPKHDDFSEPFAIEYNPTSGNHIVWNKPVIVLTNRSCYSATNNFVSVMKSLPNVRIVGAKTGGGGGMPFSAELPNGWSIRFSACPINDHNDNPIEDGIDPTIGCERHCTPSDFANGCDAIIDFAISLLK